MMVEQEINLPELEVTRWQIGRVVVQALAPFLEGEARKEGLCGIGDEKLRAYLKHLRKIYPDIMRTSFWKDLQRLLAEKGQARAISSALGQIVPDGSNPGIPINVARVFYGIMACESTVAEGDFYEEYEEFLRDPEGFEMEAIRTHAINGRPIGDFLEKIARQFFTPDMICDKPGTPPYTLGCIVMAIASSVAESPSCQAAVNEDFISRTARAYGYSLSKETIRQIIEQMTTNNCLFTLGPDGSITLSEAACSLAGFGGN